MGPRPLPSGFLLTFPPGFSSVSIQATLNEVLKFEAGREVTEEPKRQDIQEIINYRKALQAAEHELRRRPFNLNLLLKLRSVLLDSVRGRDKGHGRFRTVQNYIGAPGASIEEAFYVPPEPRLVPEYMDNWEKYYHTEERDPLVQLALVHAQFGIIHPFLDGNGRLGRILTPLFLYEKQILSRPIFYLSAYLETQRNATSICCRSSTGRRPGTGGSGFSLAP